jgi:DNA-binding transcriptional regulator YiaG
MDQGAWSDPPQHVDDGPDQLRDSAIILIGVGIVDVIHHAMFVVERDFATEQHIGERPSRRLSQEQFAEQLQIPVGTLRDWEQGRVEPDQAARAYLKVIAGKPDLVRQILKPAA